MDIGSEGLTCRGPARFTGTLALPSSCVGNSNVNGSDPIQVANLQHQYQPVYGQEYNTTVVSERKPFWWAYNAGQFLEIKAKLGSTANAGAATVTIDILKNGATYLTSVISFGSGDAASAEKTAVIPTPAYAAGDKFEVNVTATAGGGTVGKGLTVRGVTKESA